MHLHEERRRRSAELAVLDPDRDWLEIYQHLTLWELPAEARFGFQLAFYRPLAVPRMAKLLQSTGHMQFDTTRRAYDTALVIYEIIHGGVDSDRGQKMIRLMNALHDRPDIHSEEMTYLLAALMVVPTRFMDRYGWRSVAETEKVATWRFWNVLGERMGIQSRADSYSAAEFQVADYEAANFAPSDAGAALTEAALDALRHRMPAPARPLTAQLTSVLVGDPAVSEALSLPAPNRAATALVDAGGKLRRSLERRRAPAAEGWFTPGRAAHKVYPSGYDLDELGPRGT